MRDIFFWLLWEECSNIGRNNDRAAGQKNGRLSGLCERTYNERHHIKYYYKCTDSFVPAILVFCDPICDGTVFFISLPTIMRQVEGESGELFPCGGSISEEMLFFGSCFF